MLQDSFGRHVSYVRLSVTDRCDFRCSYCMPEAMQFLPRQELLTIEELALLGAAFVRRGVRRIRLTGGEPLVRRGLDLLVGELGRLLGHGLDELTLTTNGSRLAAHAAMLRAAGVERVNVSLDTLDPEKFRTITRNGRLDDVLGGIDAAAAAGLRVKINMVALAGVNDDEILPMIAWCGARGHDLTFIETMPMGAVDAGRVDQYLPLDAVRRAIGHEYALEPLFERTGGPARYARIAETGQKLGFITPLSDNFCESCNRVRVTATGTLFMCLGQDGRVELRDVLRNEGPDALDRALDRAMAQKPRGHDFVIAEGAPAVSRHMSVTGG